ncbi:transmembrane protease serine 9 [Dermacentor silvarum]|uniref:transmembrane protease serine 9 n=1 Tax=Dermacentor silvarum TaxID=543639 RepID=UPI00189B8AE9|nr:transmembrane protease serine 9 [Dermacentor silvarum]
MNGEQSPAGSARLLVPVPITLSLSSAPEPSPATLPPAAELNACRQQQFLLNRKISCDAMEPTNARIADQLPNSAIQPTQVEKPFKFASNVKPVCIPAVPKDNYNANTVVAGWGDTKEGDGDSGGPLMTLGNGRRYVQVGIVSSGDDCAKIDTPGVYTRVDAFIPWIKQVVRSLRSSDKAYSEQVPLRLASYTVPQWPFFSVPL